MFEPTTPTRENQVPIQCPQCGHNYQTPIISIVDVGVAPQLRSMFLANQLNVAVCPQCQAAVMLEVPLVYHDPKAEFLGIYFPQQLNIPEREKQKMIGELTQAMMQSLPTEQRKGYFFSPRQFASRQSMTDAVYGTMGISQEELDRQRRKAKLVEQLVVFADDPKGLQMMVKGNDGQIDGEFFSILSAMLEQASAVGDEKGAGRFEMLRENLLPITTWGKKAQKQRAAIESLQDVTTAEELVDKVAAADEDVLGAIALAVRPNLDYEFFQTLTARVDAAQGDEKTRLARVRDTLLELTQQLDDAAREELTSRVTLLHEMVNSPNPRTAVHEHMEELDDMFMSVLTRNLEAAEKKGDQPLFQRLAMVYDEIMQLIQDSAPPEVQFVNELLTEPYPDGTRTFLQNHREELSPEFIDYLGQMADEMAAREGEEAAEMVKRLRDIRSQAMLMI